MECDISILCAADAQAWAEFIQKKLSEEKYGCIVRVTVVRVQDGPMEEAVTKAHKAAQVQAVMLSPDLVEPIAQTHDPELLPDFGQLFPKQSKSVAVYCGCDVEDSVATEVLSCYFRNFHKWAKCTAGQQDGEVNKVLVTIIQVLEQEVSNGTDSGIPEEDIYAFPPAPRSVGAQQFRVFPDRVMMVGEEMLIVFEETAAKPVAIQCEADLSREVVAKEENSCTFSFTLPPEWKKEESQVELTVYCNAIPVGTATVQLETKLDAVSRLLKEAINPLELLGAALGAPWDPALMDLKLKQILQSNFPAGNFQDVFDVSSQRLPQGRRSNKETPTILHFAAKFGLKELCAELLTCPGAAQAFTVENVHGLLPNEIAAAQGHEELEKFLTDYMHTGVPIAMVYNEMISTKQSQPMEDSSLGERPPPPCPGGTYPDAPNQEKSTQSIYIVMDRNSTASNRTHDTSTYMTASELLSTNTNPPECSTHTEAAPSPHLAILSQTTLKSQKASSSPSSSTQSISEDGDVTDLPRCNSDSDDHSTSSRASGLQDEVMRSAAVGESTSQTPQPFSPAPLQTKKFSVVNMTGISQKDQALRNILQSAAEGSVSMDEAKQLVTKWDEQYRKSQSTFDSKWNAIKEFKTTTLADSDETTPAVVSARPRKSSFLSKLFKKKTKSTPDLSVESKFKTKAKKPGRSGITSVMTPTPQTNVMTPTSPTSSGPGVKLKNELTGMSAGSGLQRTNSIRVSRAMQDKDISNLPDVPSRALRHSRSDLEPAKPNKPTRLPLIKSNISTDGLISRKNPREVSYGAGYAASSPRQNVSVGLLGAQLSPRLPDPDRVPSSK
ncbi:phosphoinositide 3-kinase adapter protein 1-like [Liolophura sinensis]|uniref:phosphoinositide 3-kinase adapter protein 1-like n=1 Tax=Liolophura sinensis TaxID=3198878 RepID=UPI0031589E59